MNNTSKKEKPVLKGGKGEKMGIIPQSQVLTIIALYKVSFRIRKEYRLNLIAFDSVLYSIERYLEGKNTTIFSIMKNVDGIDSPARNRMVKDRLDLLIEKGLIEKIGVIKRTNQYLPTKKALDMLNVPFD